MNSSYLQAHTVVQAIQWHLAVALLAPAAREMDPFRHRRKGEQDSANYYLLTPKNDSKRQLRETVCISESFATGHADNLTKFLALQPLTAHQATENQ